MSYLSSAVLKLYSYHQQILRTIDYSRVTSKSPCHSASQPSAQESPMLRQVHITRDNISNIAVLIAVTMLVTTALQIHSSATCTHALPTAAIATHPETEA
jgi:hypothetical protein